jgi:hypothetical protein
MDGTYTVGEVARVSHVSVRTLHHYDEIGLLEPSARSAAGYRLYGGQDCSACNRSRSTGHRTSLWTRSPPGSPTRTRPPRTTYAASTG